MGIAFALIMFVAFAGLNATMAYFSNNSLPSPATSIAVTSAQNFVTYKNAVTNFAAANPGYSGTISNTALVPYLNGLSSAFLATVGNNIVAGTSRTIITYGQNLPAGTPAAVLSVTNNDASIGSTSSNGAWTSYSTPIATGLTLSLQNNNLVSVITTN